jgi:CubicO group peptidase (beta-lactamase class C family)
MLIKQRLFNPLGMRQSTFSTLDGSAVNPSGGAKSTAADYSRFLQMMLNNGIFNGQKILSEASVQEMKKIHANADKIKYAPKSAEGFEYALGSWVLTPGPSPTALERGTAAATILSSPGLFGTWPMVDYCRGYTAIFFVKNFLGEQKADVYLEIKKLIDGHFKSNCAPIP